MSSNINTLVVGGRIATAPERKTDSLASFVIAVNRTVKKDGGGFEDVADFIRVTVVNGLAQQVMAKAKVGERLQVSGRIHQQRWETPEGAKRSIVGIFAEKIEAEFLFKKAEAPKAEEQTELPVEATATA